MTQLRKGSHVVFRIHLHIVFVTKYRREVLTQPMLEAMKPVLERVLSANQSSLVEFNGGPDYVHLLIDLHPDNNISDLIASLKSTSSRILRQQFKEEIDKVYWGKAKRWHDSKCIISCGGAPLETLKEYIQSQSGGRACALSLSIPTV
ncbi:IS200/IS605 family transposase [Thermosynechococcaceae cyanobacterium Okahandja]